MDDQTTSIVNRCSTMAPALEGASGSIRDKGRRPFVVLIPVMIVIVVVCQYYLALLQFNHEHDQLLLPASSAPAQYNAEELQSVRNAITFDDSNSHGHNSQSAECSRDVSPILLDQWRQSKETVCSSSHYNTSIEKYVMDRWEYQPTIHVYHNIALNSLYDELEKTSASACEILAPPTVERRARVDHNHNIIETINHPVIRIQPFGIYNAYERFHAYLNVAMVMAMLNITNPQLVYMLNEKQLQSEIPLDELEMWESFSTLKPIIVAAPLLGGSSKGNTAAAVPEQSITTLLLPYVVDISCVGQSCSGTSILVTKTEGGLLRGRGTDHHCKSELFRGIIEWMRSNLLLGNISEQPKHNDGQIIQILWSSRGPYCCRPMGKMYTPTRNIAEEEALVRAVQSSLGSKYNIRRVNFGNNMTTADSVSAASNSQIMVGVHGAGLVWSGFMKQHSGLVEIFGGDRDSSNRHYHNIASLADIHYRSLTMRGYHALTWDQTTVDQIVEKIQSIDFGEEPGEN
ncbi:hypothetical protein ACHAXR_007931 [Thalassiosira sp. AJA248-18]